MAAKSFVAQTIRDQNHRGDDHIDGRRHIDGHAHTQQRYQKKTGGGAADHRAKSVGRIEVADAAAELREAAHEEPAEHRQGCAHQHRREHEQNK